MSQSHLLQVHEIQEADIKPLLDYWYNATEEHLANMGADISKLPLRIDFQKKISNQIELPYKEKKAYALIWTIDQKAMGHCNIGDIQYGESAFMHLHSWYSENRLKGIGNQLVKKSIPYFFKNFQLQKLFCQPYALNPAPNKTLEKIGFTFIKKYECTPGSINFKQEVNLYSLDKSSLEKW